MHDLHCGIVSIIMAETRKGMRSARQKAYTAASNKTRGMRGVTNTDERTNKGHQCKMTIIVYKP